jgi:hypothetical protein
VNGDATKPGGALTPRERESVREVAVIVLPRLETFGERDAATLLAAFSCLAVLLDRGADLV